MLSTYWKRGLVEKEFRQMKSQIGFNALNLQSDTSLRSKVFIIFIAWLEIIVPALNFLKFKIYVPHGKFNKKSKLI